MLDPRYEVLFRITEEDSRIYTRVLPSQSMLLDALRTIEWGAFDAELREFYCEDRGQPSYPPLVMFKFELLRYFYRLSDRDVVERSQTDLLFRYFLGIGLAAPLPHPTSLVRFRGRIGAEGFTKLFDRLVTQARAAGLIRDRLRIKDASHIIANVAVPTTLALLAQLRDKMLTAIEAVDPLVAEGFRIDLSSARQGSEHADEPTKLQVRLNLVTAMLQWIVEESLRPGHSEDDPAWQQLQSVRALAEKIVGDFADPAKGDRTRSLVDPDARRGKHGEFFDGYLVDVMMDGDSELITSLNVLPANGDEAADAIDLIEHEQQAHGNKIEQLSIDGIGFNGEVLHNLESPEGLAVDVITPPKDFQATEGFASKEFELCEEETRVRCPAGEVSGKAATRADKPNTKFFQFSRKTCWNCPLRPECHPTMGETSRTGRRVAKNRYEEEYARARAKAQTAEYQAVRKRHPAIERKLGEMVRHHGSRRARYWGLAKVMIQQLMTALVVNIKRVLNLTRRFRGDVVPATPGF
jgi:transposase